MADTEERDVGERSGGEEVGVEVEEGGTDVSPTVVEVDEEVILEVVVLLVVVVNPLPLLLDRRRVCEARS